MPATIDGSAVLGYAVSIRETPEPNAHQLNQYFGVNGQQSLFGGQRGRTFTCSGLMMADVPADLELSKQAVLSFSDGLTHTLVGTDGNSWPNVILANEWQWTSISRPTFAAGFGAGYGRTYTIQMRGLT